MMKKNLVIIPARGGSKRIKNKNVRLIAGKPLIAYTIEAARASKLVTRVVVTTDNAKIKKASLRYGAEVIDRPSRLATDTSPTLAAVYHVLETLAREEGYEPDVILLLQPTSPLRSAEDIDAALTQFRRERRESLVSVTSANPYWALAMKKGKATPIHGWRYFNSRTQELPKTYAPNGAIYILTPKSLLKHHGFFNTNMSLYVMPTSRSVDIDEEIDLRIAEVMQHANDTNR